MLTKCANPSCDSQFRYFGEGRLFLAEPTMVFKMNEEDLYARCLWLCSECVKSWRVTFTAEGHRIEPLHKNRGTAA